MPYYFSMKITTFDQIFISVLSVSILLVGWYSPIEYFGRIQTEVVLLTAVIITVYVLQLKEVKGSGFIQWGVIFAVGVLIAAVAIRLEPVWVTVLDLLLHRHFSEAGVTLNNHLHANIFLFIGLCVMFISLIGMIRLGLLRLLIDKS